MCMMNVWKIWHRLSFPDDDTTSILGDTANNKLTFHVVNKSEGTSSGLLYRMTLVSRLSLQIMQGFDLLQNAIEQMTEAGIAQQC